MSLPATHEPESVAHAQKRAAALSSVLAAFAITLLKLLTGLLTGSLGMLSESAHSGVDLIASVITLFSVRVSDRPADDDHNYGHGKIESLSAFVETVIMLASCVWIVTNAIQRIVHRQHLALTFSIWPFLVLLLSIAVDYTRSRNLHRVARRFSSEALEADAIHFSTDIWSSLAVILGLAATYAGQSWHIPVLELADPLAALVVSAIIFRISWQLARRTIDALTDATPAHSQARSAIMHDLTAIPGVLSIERLRTRRSGSSDFADITLGLPRNLTFQRTEQLTMAATAAVQRHLPGADVVVHSVPTASLAESVHDRIRAVAARANLNIHDVTVQQFADDEYPGNLHPAGFHVEQHLEVDETMPLRAAHALVTQLESEIRRGVPNIASILTHIESEPATIERPASLERDRQFEVRLRRVARAFPDILDIHDVLVTRSGGPSSSDTGEKSLTQIEFEDTGRIQVSCHCTLPDDLPMARVHAIITALESAFKLDCPEVSRLLIHPEPATDNRR